MRCLSTILCFIVSTLGGAQSISNPDFENGCSANSVGWGGGSWSLGPGYQGCYALRFDAGESWSSAYTPILGLQEEVPYELSFWASKTSSFIFGMAHVMGFTPGETPAAAFKPGFDALVPLSLVLNEEWTPLTIAFTIPVFIPELD